MAGVLTIFQVNSFQTTAFATGSPSGGGPIGVNGHGLCDSFRGLALGTGQGLIFQAGGLSVTGASGGTGLTNNATVPP
jgi:hypothetical protein